MTYRRLPPEQQQLLRSAHLLLVHDHLAILQVIDARFQQHECDTGDTTPIRLNRAETPRIIPVEAAHAEHVDEVLFRDVVLFIHIALEGGEDGGLVEQLHTALSLQI